ncbi:GIY-YIG nuclease family protein [Vibrio brasiliensis]|uniref:GIY-YIG nuclease family protein n=1 Tax=Vibrio brasiliensis TaxID=170652 RepID=UPI001EFCB1EE|nr:GIY-YIG nuclease family protein [Vibrio brasiliensis]MCG9753046.1 GIY-YIG nuclease family protein [Vibrio brasiliensis]
MNERGDIEFPIWRKKVDHSFLTLTYTPIPKWLWGVWEIDTLFGNVNSKKLPDSKVKIVFQNNSYDGFVTFTKRPNGEKQSQLSFEKDLHDLLKEAFLMTYMRSLEGQIRKASGAKVDIEKEIPFWEFIDIEFDSSSKLFKFTCHYNQQPTFPELFKQLVSSPSIKKVDDHINNKENERIYKQDWKSRSEYKNEIGAENVIYTLLDTKNKLIYIGEAKKLIVRFDAGHKDIKHWTYYKYNVLPKSLESYRLTLERMAIRDMANFLDNKADISKIKISAYKLVNRKIDK